MNAPTNGPLSTPASDAAMVAASGKSLITWLTVGQWFYVVFGVIYVLSLLGLSLFGAALGGEGAEGLPVGVGVALALLTGALFFLYFLVIGWAREWLARVRDWATQGREPGVARLGQLRLTLGRWLAFFQWLPIVLAALSLVLVLVFGGLLGAALGGLGDLGGDSSLDPAAGAALGGVFGVVLLVSLAVSFAPVVVINFLILGAVRRWMDFATDHLQGRPHPPLLPVANTVNGWFVFCQVLVGLGALLSLANLALPASLAGLSALPGADAAELAGLAATGPILVVSVVVGVLVYALQFFLLEWSKRFSAGVSRLVDGVATTDPLAAPIAPQVRLDKHG